MNLEDLKNDPVREKLENFQSSVDKIHKLLDTALNSDVYEKLTLKEKVDYDLFIAYSLNTLYWLYLRSKGKDPTQNDVKNQLTRIKEYMFKAKQAHDRQTIRPKIDQKAAGRFVKHGINYKDGDKPPNKKIRFDD